MSKKQLVTDSSVAVKWINSIDEENLTQADKLITDVESGKLELLVPELAKFEIGNALLKKKLSIEAAKASLASYYAIPINFVSWDDDLALETLEIASENKITYYDASFLALAKKFETILVTDNHKHQKSIYGVKVVALKDY